MSEFYDPAEPTDEPEVSESPVMPGFDLSEVPLPPEDGKQPSPVRTRSRGRRSSVELPKDTPLPTPPGRRSSALHSKKETPVSSTRKQAALPTPPYRKDVLDAPSSKKEVSGATPPTRRSQRGKKRDGGHYEESLNIDTLISNKKDRASDEICSQEILLKKEDTHVPDSVHYKNEDDKAEQSTPCTRGRAQRFSLKKEEGKGKVSFHIKTNKKPISQSLPLESSKHIKKLVDEELEKPEPSDVMPKVGQIIATKKPMYLPNYDDDDEVNVSDFVAADKCLVLLQKVQQKSLETRAKNSEEKILSSIQPIPELSRKIKLVPYDDDNGDSEKDTDSPIKDKVEKYSDQLKGRTRGQPQKRSEHFPESSKTYSKDRDSSLSPSAKRKTRSVNERESSRSPSRRKTRSRDYKETSPNSRRKSKSASGRETSRSPSSRRKTRSSDDRDSSRSPISRRKTRSGNAWDNRRSPSSKKKPKSGNEEELSGSPSLKKKHSLDDTRETGKSSSARRKTRSTEDRESRSPSLRRQFRSDGARKLSSSPSSRRKSQSADDRESSSSPCSRRKIRSSEEDTATSPVSRNKNKKEDENESLRKNTKIIHEREASMSPFSERKKLTDERETSWSPSLEQQNKSFEERELSSSPELKARQNSLKKETKMSARYDKMNRSADEREVSESPTCRRKSSSMDELEVSLTCFQKSKSYEREISRSPSLDRKGRHSNRESSRSPSSKGKDMSVEVSVSPSSRKKQRSTDEETSISPSSKLKARVVDEFEISKSPNSRRKHRENDREHSSSPVSHRRAKVSGDRDTSRSPSARRKTRSGETYERRKSNRNSPSPEKYRRRYSPRRRSKSPYSPPRRRRSPDRSRRRRRYSRSDSRSPDRYRRKYSPRKSSYSPEYKYSRSPDRRRYRYSPRLSSSPDSPDRFGRSKKRYRRHYSSPARSRSPVYKKYDEKYLKDKSSKKSDSDATALSDFDIMSIPLPDSGQPLSKQKEKDKRKSVRAAREKQETPDLNAAKVEIFDVPLPSDSVCGADEQKLQTDKIVHNEQYEIKDTIQPIEKNDKSYVISQGLDNIPSSSLPPPPKQDVPVKEITASEKQKTDSKISFKLKSKNKKGKIEEVTNKSSVVFSLSAEDESSEISEKSAFGSEMKDTLVKKSVPSTQKDIFISGPCELLKTTQSQPVSDNNTHVADLKAVPCTNEEQRDEQHKFVDLQNETHADVLTVTQEPLSTESCPKNLEDETSVDKYQHILESEGQTVLTNTDSNMEVEETDLKPDDKSKGRKTVHEKRSSRKRKCKSSKSNVDGETKPVMLDPKHGGDEMNLDKIDGKSHAHVSSRKEEVCAKQDENYQANTEYSESINENRHISESYYIVSGQQSLPLNDESETVNPNSTDLFDIGAEEAPCPIKDKTSNSKSESYDLPLSCIDKIEVLVDENGTLKKTDCEDTTTEKEEATTKMQLSDEFMAATVESDSFNEKRDKIYVLSDELSADKERCTIDSSVISSSLEQSSLKSLSPKQMREECDDEKGIDSSFTSTKEDILPKMQLDVEIEETKENVETEQDGQANIGDMTHSVYPFSTENVNNSALCESDEEETSLQSSRVDEFDRESVSRVEKPGTIDTTNASSNSENVQDTNQPTIFVKIKDHLTDNKTEEGDKEQINEDRLTDSICVDSSDSFHSGQVETTNQNNHHILPDISDGDLNIPPKTILDTSEMDTMLDDDEKKLNTDDEYLSTPSPSIGLHVDGLEKINSLQRTEHENEKSQKQFDTIHEKSADKMGTLTSEVNASITDDQEITEAQSSVIMQDSSETYPGICDKEVCKEVTEIGKEVTEGKLETTYNLSEECSKESFPSGYDGKVLDISADKSSAGSEDRIVPKSDKNILSEETNHVSDNSSLENIEKEEHEPDNATVEPSCDLPEDDKEDTRTQGVDQVMLHDEAITSKTEESVDQQDLDKQIVYPEEKGLVQQDNDSREASLLQQNDQWDTCDSEREANNRSEFEDLEKNKNQEQNDDASQALVQNNTLSVIETESSNKIDIEFKTREKVETDLPDAVHEPEKQESAGSGDLIRVKDENTHLVDTEKKHYSESVATVGISTAVNPDETENKSTNSQPHENESESTKSQPYENESESTKNEPHENESEATNLEPHKAENVSTNLQSHENECESTTENVSEKPDLTSGDFTGDVIQAEKSEESISVTLNKTDTGTEGGDNKVGEALQSTEKTAQIQEKDENIEQEACKDDDKPKPEHRFDQTADDVDKEKNVQESETSSRRRSGRIRSLEERKDENKDERKDSRSQDKERRGRDDRKDRDRRSYDDRRDSHRRDRDRRRHDDDDRSHRDDRRRGGRDYDRYDRRDRDRDRDSHRRRSRDEYDDEDYDSRSSKRPYSRYEYKDRKSDHSSDSVDAKRPFNEESSKFGQSALQKNDPSETVTPQVSQNQYPYPETGTSSDTRDENLGCNQVRPEKVKSRWRRSCEAEMNDNGYPLNDADSSFVDVPPPPSQSAEFPPNLFADVTQETNEKDAASTIQEIIPVPFFEELEDNVYLAERRRSKQMKEVRRMVCDCTTTSEERENGIDACGEDCLNRMLLIECGNRCPCGEFCQNKKFQKHIKSNVSIFQTEYKGHGLMANENLPPGQFIMEYVGEVLDYKQFKARTKIYAKSGSEHYYFMALNGDEIIDATSKGNISRFINHSCDPNCETQKWTVNGYLRVGFFTKKEIAPGEELTFDYQFEIYGREPQKCFCSTPKCRGFLGQKSTPLKRKKKIVPEPEETEDGGNEMDVEQEKKKNELFEDECFEEELEKISELGLRNKEEVLMLCRMMVRAEKENHRKTILEILKETKEAVCLRLFLDYHGLSLLWSWMTDIGQGFIELKKLILSTLRILPISNKTILEESKILSLVQRWAGELAKKQVESEKPEEDAQKAESNEDTEMKDEEMNSEEINSEEMNSESVPPLPSTFTSSAPVSILSINKENKPAKKRVKFAIESSDSEASAEFSDTPLSDSDPQCSEVSASDSAQVSEDDQSCSEIKEYPTLKKRLKLAESSHETVDNSGIQSASADTSQEHSIDESKDITQSSQVTTCEQKEEVKMDMEVSDDKVDSESSSPDDDSGSQDEEETPDVENKGEITGMAVDLLEHWSDLKDLFKIPKKERIEERKRTERELDMRINEDSYGQFGGRGPSAAGSLLSSSDWSTGDRNDRKRRSEESPDKRRRDKLKKYDKEPRKSRFSPAIDPKLSKKKKVPTATLR